MVGLVFTPDSTILATASWDNTVRLWHVPDGRPVCPPLQNVAGLDCLQIGPGGRLLATGSMRAMVQFWEIPTGLPVGPPLATDGRVVALAFSADGRTLLAGSLGKSAHFWPVPYPAGSSLEQIRTTLELATGLSLDEQGMIHALTPDDCQEHRQRMRRVPQ